MTPYRKRPVVIEAIQWTGDNLREVIDAIGLHESARKWTWEEYAAVVARDGLKIFTLEGPLMASIGDWIIKGVKGEFYPCKPDIFAATYDALHDEAEKLADSCSCGETIRELTSERDQYKAIAEDLGRQADARRGLVAWGWVQKPVVHAVDGRCGFFMAVLNITAARFDAFQAWSEPPGTNDPAAILGLKEAARAWLAVHGYTEDTERR